MSFNDRVIEEIGLEGLDGITIPALWLRLSTCQPPFSLKLDPQSKEFIWNEVICPHPEFEFYRLPQPRPPVAFKQRFSTNPEELAECTSLLMEGDDPYPVHPIKDEVHGIFGSCLTYKTRVNITEDIRDSDCTPKLTLEQAEEKYGEQMAIVASQKQRSFSLLMNEEVGLNNMSAIYYAVLERIGRLVC
ncbi:hypothetical protein CAPTEDRAFT_95451 [Capitella teleta]|uniref:General transcription factor 3C polypeptide 1 winged-helix domain-containing protein n=1 Tax=Capitella teleta TaxID=283909 RepID=R7UZY7_CAPTE|nr:hypothetical protein CAPTEDRAFT_95451 [Capitella teleta]|eukprot:ELU11827.1 hypothetical protein CAPTEDRAFT_95451 [Capitella teleta]